MGRLVISGKWLAEMESRIFQSQDINEVLQNAISQKALIALLAKYETPFQVIDLGCGVRRITTKVGICPKCNGTGKC